MQHHVDPSHPEQTDAADAGREEEDDLTIDFVPELHQLARPRRVRGSGLPRWAIVGAVLSGTAVVFAALAIKPKAPVKQAANPTAEIVGINGQPVTSDKIEVFELPPWNDNEPGARMAVIPQD